MGKRATRKAKAGDGIRDLEVDALKAENLHLKEEIERLRLRNAGAHPAAALADALQSADDAGDSADDALTMYASSMVIRSELIELLALFKSTIQDYERRLEMLTGAPASVEVSRDEDELDEIDLTVTEDEADEDDLEDDEQDDDELVAEADDEDDEQDDDELVAEADDAQNDDAEQHDAVTIDLRDKGRKKDNVTTVNGSRRKGGNRDRSRDEDTAPAAKGA